MARRALQPLHQRQPYPHRKKKISLFCVRVSARFSPASLITTCVLLNLTVWMKRTVYGMLQHSTVNGTLPQSTPRFLNQRTRSGVIDNGHLHECLRDRSCLLTFTVIRPEMRLSNGIASVIHAYTSLAPASVYSRTCVGIPLCVNQNYS